MWYSAYMIEHMVFIYMCARMFDFDIYIYIHGRICVLDLHVC